MTHPLLQHAFDLFEQRGVIGTERVIFAGRAAARVPEILEEFGVHKQKVLVLHDAVTFDVAAKDAMTAFADAGWPYATYCCEGSGDNPPACTDTHVSEVIEHLHDVSFDRVLTIGSGTITDIGKLVAQSRGVDLISMATAPSMNGYTSKIAAILKDGVKQTVPSVAAQLCIADPSVLADAPGEMIGAGVGDAYSRFVAKSDWKLSHLLHGTTYDPQLAALLADAANLLRSVPKTIDKDRQNAITNLSVVLYVTGLAQQAALPGTQASGGEHLVSHYLDMLAGHPDFSHKADLHGRQVAVGTVFTARLYEALDDVDFGALDLDSLVASHFAPDRLAEHLRRHFRGLAGAVLKRALANYPDAAGLRTRLRAYQRQDLDIRSDAMAPWVDADTLALELEACGAPTTFAQIGVSPELRDATVTHCRHVRNRFTALHLASELQMDNVALEIAGQM